MIEKKIKVQIDSFVYRTLIGDAYSFGFVKSNDEVNKNKFINTLILNYYDEYQEKQNDIYGILRKNNITNPNEIFDEIKRINNSADKDFEDFEILNFKATKETEYYYDLIEENLSDGVLAHYYRDMFVTYSNLRQDKREEIIFRKIVDKIKKAISQNKQIALYHKEEKDIVRPFKLCKTKEGLFNYLLVMKNTSSWVTSYKLSNIDNVFVLRESSTFNDTELELLKTNMKNGPQFVTQRNTLAEVILTPKGEKKFKSIYFNRPELIKKEMNHYFFNAADFQIETYFIRFGSDAFVLHPRHVRNNIFKFFSEGCNSYKKN